MARRLDAIVIGAGAAGLAAAEVLSREGLAIEILEARSRIGGRIHTLRPRGLPIPIELGAEFVHGREEELLSLAREAAIAVDRLPEAHLSIQGRRTEVMHGFWERYDSIARRLRSRGRDRSIADFLRSHPRMPVRDRRLLASTVEGYDAADLDRASEIALSTAGQPREDPAEHAQFRVASGYDRVPRWLAGRLDSRRARLRLRTEVARVKWRRGAVAVTTSSGETLRAPCAVISVPAGVLQAPPGARGAIAFDPDPVPIRRALSRIAMGDVVRLVLRFEKPFWTDPEVVARRVPAEKRGEAEIGFVHLEGAGADFPTLWSAAPSQSPVLVAWSGGPAARRLLSLPREELVARAFEVLARVWRMDAAKLRRGLTAWHIHDWSRDPHARGAYSYQTVGGAKAPDALARPVAATLFFAGEATEGQRSGTVPGAISSGRSAARRLLRAIGRARST